MAERRHSQSLEAENWAHHRRTYEGFVRGTLIFAAHVLVVLAVVGWVLAGAVG